MRRKIDWIIFFGGCAIIVIGLIERSIANTISELDGNSMNDLVADGVKETTTKGMLHKQINQRCKLGF